MFEIYFYFGSPAFFAAFVALAAAGIAWLSWAWPWLTVERHLARAAIALGAAELVVLGAWALTCRFDADEIEHLHASWLVSQGAVPFRDFWQNHFPLFWYLIVPVVRPFHSALVVFFARSIAILLFVLLALVARWLCSRVFADRATAACASLLVFAQGVRVEAAWLRPDQLANIAALAGIAVAAINAPAAGSAFLSGLLLAFSLSITPKAFLLVLAFPLAVLTSPELKTGAKLRLWLFHFLGGVAGALPLLGLLLYSGTLRLAVDWALLHPVGKMNVARFFPAVLALLAAWSASRLASRFRYFPTALLVIAFVLQTIGTLLTPYLMRVDLMLWCALASVLAARPLVAWVGEAAAAAQAGGAWGPRARAAAAFVLVLAGGIAGPALFNERLGNASSDRDRLNWMIRAADAGTVVAVCPLHPIFARDATRLYHLWQYNHWVQEPAMRTELAGFAADFVHAPPTLILAAPRRFTDDATPAVSRPTVFDQLASAGVISPEVRNALQQYVNAHYVLVETQHELFYVRRH